MDTTKIEFIDKNIDKVINGLKDHPSGLSAGQTALIGALIGALAAILAQLIIFLLTKKKEKSELKNKLLSEERGLAYLISAYQTEMIEYDVEFEHFFQASIIFSGTEHEKHSYDKSFSFREKYLQAKIKCQVSIAEYFKTISLFNALINEKKNILAINNELNQVRDFEPRKASEFSQIKDYNLLYTTKQNEKIELKRAYNFCSEKFDLINSIMIKC